MFSKEYQLQNEMREVTKGESGYYVNTTVEEENIEEEVPDNLQ